MTNDGIEIFGLCGAGKTTLTRELLSTGASGPAASGLSIRPNDPTPPRGWHSYAMACCTALTYGFRDPGGCARLVRDAGGRWLLMKLGHRVARLRERDTLAGTLLVDSGVLQPLVSFEVEYNLRGLRWQPHLMMRGLPLPARAVYVRVKPETALRRYLKRERGFPGGITREALHDRFSNGYRIAEEIYETCRTLGVECAVYDNDQPATSSTTREFGTKISGIRR